MSKRLEGRIAVVSGGGAGIGKGIAHVLAKEGGGHCRGGYAQFV